MRILWIELTNYIGIYNGLGLNTINIDFTKCKTNKILIKGLNGSGKSTLYNALSINPDSNDFFVPGVEARKNVCVVCDGIRYTIRYIHGVDTNGNRITSKGYISKFIETGETELNPNGNISSCKETIYNEFNLDSNFMALSQLSTEDRGLAYKIPSARKKFVTNIINVLEVYNNINKVISKKASIFRNTINTLTLKIDSIGDEMTLQLNLKAIDDRLLMLDREKNAIVETIAALKVKAEEANSVLRNNNYDTITAELSDITRSTKSMIKDIALRIHQFDGVKEPEDLVVFINDMNKTLITIETNIDRLRSVIPTRLAEREAEASKLQDKTEKLNSLQSEYNYMDVKKAVNDARDIITKYDAVFAEMGLNNVETITKDEFEAGMESLTYLTELAGNLISVYSQTAVLSVYNARKFTIDLRSKIKSINEQYDCDKELYHQLEKELIEFAANRKIADELSNRPDKCSIDSCYFIQSAVEADKKYPEDIYNKKLKYADELRLKISETESIIQNFELSNEILMHIESVERELKSRARFIQKLPVSKDFISTFMERATNADPFSDIDRLHDYVDCGNFIEEYKVAKENLRRYEAEYQIYESKNQLIESIIEDIELITERTNQLSNDIENINDEIKNLELERENARSIINRATDIYNKYHDVYLPDEAKRQELESIKQSLEGSVELLNSIQGEINAQYNSLGIKESEIKNVTVQRDQLKHQASQLQEYKQELEIYNNKYIKIEKIKYYSSPSTGIQTLFMELYMNKTIAIANNLLSLLFGGEFVLQPFIINENEFRIPCVGNGLMHDDISSMSTAQKCMISMILSFSLLYQSSTKYNIIKLDEIDGGLDSINRPYFITLLDNLMSMLKCEQAFIISHNSELDDTSCDVILLRDDPYNSLVSEKANVIWRAS